MWKFSLREIILVMTLFGIAMAVNVWSHRELRSELERATEYARNVEEDALNLHRQFGYAKMKSDETNAQIAAWIKSGELKPVPYVTCGNGSVSPDWAVLDKPLASRFSN